MSPAKLAELLQLYRKKDKFDIISQVDHLQIYLDYPQFTNIIVFVKNLDNEIQEKNKFKNFSKTILFCELVVV